MGNGAGGGSGDGGAVRIDCGLLALPFPPLTPTEPLLTTPLGPAPPPTEPSLALPAHGCAANPAMVPARSEFGRPTAKGGGGTGVSGVERSRDSCRWPEGQLWSDDVWELVSDEASTFVTSVFDVFGERRGYVGRGKREEGAGGGRGDLIAEYQSVQIGATIDDRT